MSPTTEEMGRHPPALHALLRLHVSAGLLLGVLCAGLFVDTMGAPWGVVETAAVLKLAIDLWRAYDAQPDTEDR